MWSFCRDAWNAPRQLSVGRVKHGLEKAQSKTAPFGAVMLSEMSEETNVLSTTYHIPFEFTSKYTKVTTADIKPTSKDNTAFLSKGGCQWMEGFEAVYLSSRRNPQYGQ